MIAASLQSLKAKAGQDSLLVDWQHVSWLTGHLGMYLRPHLKHFASLFEIMGKSKEIVQEIRKRIMERHKSGSSLGAYFF